jgi:hypothetical protein
LACGEPLRLEIHHRLLACRAETAIGNDVGTFF